MEKDGEKGIERARARARQNEKERERESESERDGDGKEERMRGGGGGGGREGIRWCFESGLRVDCRHTTVQKFDARPRTLRLLID
jgi:hypothetical protein